MTSAFQINREDVPTKRNGQEKIAPFEYLERPMKVPAVASRMREIAEIIQEEFPAEAFELGELANELRRRSPGGPRAPATSTPMTPELAEEIREFAEANPTMSQQDVGVVFNVNHGRISEVLKGKRE